MRELLSLEIAGIRIDVRSAGSLNLSQISPAYRQFIAGPDRPPGDVTVEILLEAGGLPETRGKKIFDADRAWSIFSDGDGYLLEMKPPPLEEPLWVARFDRGPGNVRIYCGEPSIRGGTDRTSVLNPIGYPLDQVLVMHILSQHKGALFHAAGMQMQNGAYMFPGRSGAGKSTISRLLRDRDMGELLSDDRVIVRKTEDAFRAFGTPWPGDAGIAENRSARLEGIFFIRHADENQINNLTPPEALKNLLPVVSVPWYDEDPMSDILSVCEDLVYDVPAYEFSFRPDRSAADFLENLIKRQRPWP